jgi:hypothetical protein
MRGSIKKLMASVNDGTGATVNASSKAPLSATIRFLEANNVVFIQSCDE